MLTGLNMLNTTIMIKVINCSLLDTYTKCFIETLQLFTYNIMHLFKQKVGITIKSKETSGKLAIYSSEIPDYTHSTSHTGYYLCWSMQTQLQLVS